VNAGLRTGSAGLVHSGPLPPAGSLHYLAARGARLRPDATAVDGPCGHLCYGELWGRASGLAAELVDRGVRAGDRVVVWCDPVDAIVCMHAVLLLGAVYVPVASDSPVARTVQLAEDCTASVVCTAAERVPALAGTTSVPALDCRALSMTGRVFRARVDVRAGDPAYILYTSGSTGTPKGVVISHRNARAFVDWAAAEFGLGPGDRLANHSALTFDLSVLDIYGAFAAGAAVVPVPEALRYDAHGLTRFCHRERITVWYSVPSVLMLMMRFGGLTDTPPPAGLRMVLFAGEPFPIRSVRRLADWFPGRLYNLYGPTETNVCAYHAVTPVDVAGDEPLPIGRACSGDRLWIRDGQLYVDGPTVFQGYWNGPPQRGPYPTGDLVRELPGGALAYLGRIDDMLKVRGHRVEPAEIEAAADGYPGVVTSAVVCVGNGLDARLALVAEVEEGAKVRPLALRAYLARRLPAYLIPDDVVVTGDMPRGARGKVDRAAARALATEAVG
jgi:clorobiocin biosynthesis protein CloN4